MKLEKEIIKQQNSLEFRLESLDQLSKILKGDNKMLDSV